MSPSWRKISPFGGKASVFDWQFRRREEDLWMRANFLAAKGPAIADGAATPHNAIAKQILVKLYVTPVSVVDKVYTTLFSGFVVQ
jgi:hypothetical protein